MANAAPPPGDPAATPARDPSAEDRFLRDDYDRVIQDIRQRVAANAIRFLKCDGSDTAHEPGPTMTRGQLAQKLADCHNTTRNSASQTNAAFLDMPAIAPKKIEKALENPQGYASPAGWQCWAGHHDGSWYGPHGDRFPDEADWMPPEKEPAKRGPKRPYDFQRVHFTGPDERWGWNQSHPDVPYVWGWDPKPGLDIACFAPHIGFVFDCADAKAIIWITPAEAFLEVIRPAKPRTDGDTTPRKRTSCSTKGGIGQWTVG